MLHPLAGRLYVTLYVPGVVDAILTDPFVAPKLKPAGVDENVPPEAKPVAKTGVGFITLEQ